MGGEGDSILMEDLNAAIDDFKKYKDETSLPCANDCKAHDQRGKRISRIETTQYLTLRCLKQMIMNDVSQTLIGVPQVPVQRPDTAPTGNFKLFGREIMSFKGTSITGRDVFLIFTVLTTAVTFLMVFFNFNPFAK